MRDLLPYLKDHTPDMLRDIEKLVRLESPSRDAAGIHRVQDVNQEWFGSFGKVKRSASPLGDLLHVQIEGTTRSRMVLLAHMDTVYPVGSWQSVWKVEGDKAYGPGTYDMKAGGSSTSCWSGVSGSRSRRAAQALSGLQRPGSFPTSWRISSWSF